MSGADSQQAGLLAVAALIVALKAWHGWRLGAVRQAIGLGALAVAVMAGFAGAPVAEPLLEPSADIPEAARVPLAGVLIAVVVYLAITLFSAVLFKKTEHQKVGVIRFGYGFLGAILGAVFGLVIAAALLTGFLVLNGHPEIVAHLRAGEFEKALGSATAPPATPSPPKPSRTRPR